MNTASRRAAAALANAATMVAVIVLIGVFVAGYTALVDQIIFAIAALL